MVGFLVGTMIIMGVGGSRAVEGTMTNIKAEEAFMAVGGAFTVGVALAGDLLQIKTG
jgi:hypothetical protein